MTTARFIDIRKFLHQHPEVSGDELKTSEYVVKFLKELSSSFSINTLGDNSVIVSIGNSEGTHIAFRCELDALPIQEENDFDYTSSVDGVSHKCGHDGHMTIMLLFAQKLLAVNLDEHYVSLIFQAAEENGKGAQYVIEHSDLFKRNLPTYIFSLHNIPAFPANEIIVKEGGFTPEVRSVQFYFKGKTTHASEPLRGINPAYIMAQMIEITELQNETDVSSSDFNLITPIYAHLGSKSYGIAAGYAELGFTLRSWSKQLAAQTKTWIENMAERLGEEQNIEVSYEWFDEFSSIQNDTYCCQKIRLAAEELSLSVHEKTEPMAFGEDFGLYTSATKGAMFGIGAGLDSAALHNPDYDFNDALIEPASNMFLEILNQIKND